MHVPDHFLPMSVTAPAAAIATGAVVLAATAGRPRITTRDTLLAGTTAAMIFGAQMVNYPIAGGVSGHLIGGALATALLGPRLALLAMTAVVGVQALLFADGGINALGVNVLLMAVLPVLVTAAVRIGAERLGLGKLARTTAAVSAGLSVPVSAAVLGVAYSSTVGTGAAAAFIGELTAVHLTIGLGEALITAAVLSAVMAFAPGVAAWDARPSVTPVAVRRGLAAIGGLGVVSACALALVASGNPDGLEHIVGAYSLPVGDAAFAGLPGLADYGTLSGTEFLAALAGLAATAVLGAALAAMGRTPVRQGA
ncbi:energy-coupling factor ABC transporter permease [Rhodococcus pyridinivorans]|uniref:Cobalamin (Vitamin B12) biosynthesis CbiM protein n=1 Tax=Rhodococcus pyridinivorans AK37 TaxID=1114960 RepID=H0JQY6_9NOCA|nr:energy-coupling factor ABC transporter permease [Rhodococcus pyridinivorans]EHK83769.1 cobalamin (vitamin B12) biosynthesis CbiM protein [Rhodococcus pyridinivorans AK37]MCD2140247.1 energy-coupling factor ABC transporter permease [Rhodococcus pyridinivorans]